MEEHILTTLSCYKNNNVKKTLVMVRNAIGILALFYMFFSNKILLKIVHLYDIQLLYR